MLHLKLNHVYVILLLCTVCACSFSGEPLKVGAVTQGAISITFDDGTRTQYTRAFSLMRARDITGTFYIPTGNFTAFNKISVGELLEMQNAGNEIGSHGVNHLDFSKLTIEQMHYECSASKQYLEANGLKIDNFAYPFGTGNLSLANSVVSQYYRSARIVYYTPMKAGSAPFQLPGYHGESSGSEYSTLLSRLKGAVDRAVNNNEWTIFYFHNLLSKSELALMYGGIAEPEFVAFLDYARASGVRILTVNQALNLAVAPTGSIIINGGDTHTASELATLSLTYPDAKSDICQVRYSNDGVWDTERWESPAATKSWTLTSGDGTKTVYYQISNVAGLTSTTYSDSIKLDTTPPTGSIVVNGGDSSTASASVTLSVAYSDADSGVAQVRYGSDGNWDSESWEPPSATRAWTLTFGEGTKTVYYQVKDNAGVTSTTYYDTITLRTTTPNPPPDSSNTKSTIDKTKPIANAGLDLTVNENATVILDGSASRDNIGVVSYTWKFKDGTDKTLTGKKQSYMFTTPGVYPITLKVNDAAGNMANDTVVVTVLDITDPVADAGQDQYITLDSSVSFYAGESNDNVGLFSIEWDFGDGVTGIGKNVTHTYVSAGNYVVTLTVKDQAGNSGIDTVVVAVSEGGALQLWHRAGETLSIILTGTAIAVWFARKQINTSSKSRKSKKPNSSLPLI